MFSPYPWQEKQWCFLLSEVRQNRLAHALLLDGAAGFGKTDFASALSAYILCDQTNEAMACGECQSCRWLQAGSHPDFFRVVLEEKSKSIKVDQVRTLISQLDKTSQRASYQIALIESAHTMNRASANALLKTLEEPLGQVLIILVADRLNALPATIISRCQLIKFSSASNDAAIHWLQERIQPDMDPKLLLKVSDDAPLRALQYVELGYYTVRDTLLRHLLQIQRREVDPIAPVTELLKQELSLLLTILMSMVLDVVRLQHGVKVEALSHVDRLDQLQSLAKLHDRVKLHGYFQSCQKTLAAVQSGVPLNEQLVLENILVEYYLHVC